MRTYSGWGHPRLVKCSYEVGLLVVDRGEVVEGATQPPGVVVPVDPSGGCDSTGCLQSRALRPQARKNQLEIPAEEQNGRPAKRFARF